MALNGSNNPNLPDEADLLAWVEGETLSPEANAAVARALLADPVLARRMELMRSDRLALRSLGEERAPGGLLSSVEAALQPVLERELLLGLRDEEPADSHPVVSMVRPEKRGIFQTFLADRAGRRMALAASLLVLIGGATWWGTVWFSRTPPKMGPIAMKESSTRAAESTIAMKDSAAPETAQPGKIDDGMRITHAPERFAPAGIEAAMSKEAAPVVAAALVGPVREAMDAGLAAELAKERKLVVRVVSREAISSPRGLCDRLKKEFNTPAWRLTPEVPTELASALEAHPLVVDHSQPAVVNPEPQVFAGDQGFEPIMGPPAPREVPIIEESEPQPVYLVQARLDAATMSQLKTSLEKAGRTAEVVFEERYEPLPLASGGTPVLTPAAVLWWTNPPAGWTTWGEVPVVIEPK